MGLGRALFCDTGSDSDGAGELGDIVSTEGDCTEGEGNVQQLKDFFAKAGSPAKWKPAVDTLVASFDAAEARWTRKLPFSTVCGEIKAIGAQAKELQNQIAASSGIAPPPTQKSPPSATDELAKVGGWLLGGFWALEILRGLRKK